MRPFTEAELSLPQGYAPTEGRDAQIHDDLAALSVRFMEAVRDREIPLLEYHLGEEFTLTTGRASAPARSRASLVAAVRSWPP